MCSSVPQFRSYPVARRGRLAPGAALLATLVAPALGTALLAGTAGAEPMSVQPVAANDWLSVSVMRHDEPATLPTIRPLEERPLDRPHVEPDWRAVYGSSFADGETSGVVASYGRVGIAVDSSSGAEGPRIRGLAWSPSPDVRVIAGGNLGGGGLGASLTVRLSF